MTHALPMRIDFIDPTWAPGIMSGWLEDGVLKNDAECSKPEDGEDEEEDHQKVCST